MAVTFKKTIQKAQSTDPLAAEFAAIRTAIRAQQEQNCRVAITVGKRLIVLKGQLEHGQFCDRLAEEVPELARTTAERFMRIAREVDAQPMFAKLSDSAIALVAAKTTPGAIKAEIVERLTQGEALTFPNVVTLIKGAKDATETKLVISEKAAEALHSDAAETAAAKAAEKAVAVLKGKLPKSDFESFCRQWSKAGEAFVAAMSLHIADA